MENTKRIRQLMTDLNLSVADLALMCDKAEVTIYNAISGRSEFPGYLYLALECHERAKAYLSGVVEESRKNKEIRKLRDAEKYRKHICGV